MSFSDTLGRRWGRQSERASLLACLLACFVAMLPCPGGGEFTRWVSCVKGQWEEAEKQSGGILRCGRVFIGKSCWLECTDQV